MPENSQNLQLLSAGGADLCSHLVQLPMQKESRLPFTSTRERQKENDRNPVQNAAEISRSGPHGG